MKKNILNENIPPGPPSDATANPSGPPADAVPSGPPADTTPIRRPTSGRRYRKCQGPDLSIGCRGDNVADLQRKILDYGIDLSPYGADGKFGNKTKRGLLQLQTKLGVDTTGIYDQATRDAVSSGSPSPSGQPAPPATPAPSGQPAPAEPPVEPIGKTAPAEPPVVPPPPASQPQSGESKEKNKQSVYSFIDSFQSKLNGRTSYLRNVKFGNDEDMKDLADYLIDNKNYSSGQALEFFKKIFDEKVQFVRVVDSEQRIKSYSKYDLIFSRSIGEYMLDSNSLIEFRKEELKKIYNSINQIMDSNDRKTILGRFKNFILSKIETFSPQLASTLSESKLQQNYYLEPVKSRFNKIEKLVFERLVKGCK